MGAKQFGKYELLECLGRGGMGEVWKALDTQLRRYVAVKLLHANLQANPDFITHFMREAQFVASLHHPNIVQVHDFQIITEQGSDVKAYMVMDYIEGGTLADYIRHTSRRSLFPSATDIVYLLTGISLALDHAHKRGMIHRDIKPANILMDNSGNTGNLMGNPILTDFGIARLQNTDASTLTNAMIGTPLYVSPEQARNEPISARSDLYSLGIVLYELLTGVTPFRGESAVSIMMQQAYEMPTPPALINPTISPALSAVMLQAISKDPMARFPSAIAMTLAVAQAFNISAPASLNRLEHTNELPGNSSHLSQPFSPLPDISTHYLTHPHTSFSLLTGQPVVPVVPNAQVNSTTPPSSEKNASYIAMHQSETASTLITPTDIHYAPEQHPPSAQSSLSPQQSSPATPMRPSTVERKSVFIALAIGVILILVAISAFSVYPLLHTKNGGPLATSTTPSSVGRITFISSQNASPNTFDKLQIDLANIPPPPTGTVYYAWLENTGETGANPHWQIQLSNGTLHKLYGSNSSNTDLFSQSSLFLITAESVNNVPIVPIPDPGRLYYATITHQYSSSPTFEVMQCPSSGATGSGSPCM